MTDPFPPQQFGHPSTWPQSAEANAMPAPPYVGPSPFPPAPTRRPKRNRTGVWAGVLVAVVVVVTGGAVAIAGATGRGPAASVFKDSGVAACESIRDNAAAAKATPSPNPAASTSPAEQLKAYQQFRKQFADSRYDDLRTAGTEVLDLIYQMSGTGNSDADTGLLLVAAGQLVQKWGSLAGACANHGVTIPRLNEMSG